MIVLDSPSPPQSQFLNPALSNGYNSADVQAQMNGNLVVAVIFMLTFKDNFPIIWFTLQPLHLSIPVNKKWLYAWLQCRPVPGTLLPWGKNQESKS